MSWFKELGEIPRTSESKMKLFMRVLRCVWFSVGVMTGAVFIITTPHQIEKDNSLLKMESKKRH